MVLFVVLICAAYLIYNFAHPKKINWLMSLVDDSRRGAFTANKEIISLVCGMLFSFLMGAVIDRFAESGEIRTAFILSAAVIFILMLLHTLTMIFTVEKETPNSKNGSFRYRTTHCAVLPKRLPRIADCCIIYRKFRRSPCIRTRRRDIFRRGAKCWR